MALVYASACSGSDLGLSLADIESGSPQDTTQATDSVATDVDDPSPSVDAASLWDVGKDIEGEGSTPDGGSADDPCEDGGCLGDPCTEDSDCFSGLCVDHLGDKACSKTCDEECPPGWLCDQVDLGGDVPVFICVSKYEHLCRPCMTSDDCASETSEAACVDYGVEGAFCGASCSEDADCPDGYLCQDSVSVRGGGSSQCVNASGVCECSAEATALGLATDCAVENQWGLCEGMRSCGAEGLSACDASIPAQESCNGLDDDCDGQTDNLSCDDNNPCTEDSCQGVDGCRNDVQLGAPCDDGDLTTAGDSCTADGVCLGQVIDCPLEPCILTSNPNGEGCDTVFSEPQTSCDDGDPATKDDVCDGQGACLGVPYTCTPSQCEESSEPDGQGCAVVLKAPGTPCDDAALDTKNDACDSLGLCQGTPFTCVPSQCELSSEPNGAECEVTYAPAALACDDGDPGTKVDVCDGAGGCSGMPYVCEPQQCDALSTPNGSTCDTLPKAAGVPCDDGELSTAGDVCDGAGQCNGTPFSCEVGVCELSSTPDGAACQVVYAPLESACDDGDPSTKVDICDGQGGCAGTPFVCEATQCEASSEPDGSGCHVINKASGVSCDDGDLSTKDDTCDGAGGCVGVAFECSPGVCELSSTTNGTDCDIAYAPAQTPCDDGLLSTTGDVCDGSGGCSGEPYDCSPGVCESASEPNGVGCAVTYSAPGTACDDGDVSTNADSCDGLGECAGTPYICSPGICEVASNPNGEGCDAVFSPTGTACDDNNVATQGDVCDGSGGCSGTPYFCEASQCEFSSEPDGVGCNVVFKAPGSECDDGDLSTGADVCDGSGGCSGSPIVCVPGQCEVGSEPNGAGCTPTFAQEGLACDDNNPNTQNDVCDGAGGCEGVSYTCEATQCELASEPNGVGCTVTFKAPGSDCDDGDITTGGDVCDGSGGCSGSPILCVPSQCEVTSTPNGIGCSVVNATEGQACDDNDPTTKEDQCDGGGLCVGSPYTCSPGQCDASSEPDGEGCAVIFKSPGTPCDDGSDGTAADVCNGTGACTGTPISCSAGVCESDSIPNGVGCTPVYSPSGQGCDDGDPTTQNDQCNGLGGCLGTPYTCSVGQCEASSTPNGSDCSVVYSPTGTGCDDGNPATIDDQCNGGGVCVGSATVCGDGVQQGLEACDDGNTITEFNCDYGTPSCTGCRADCSSILNLSGPFCGDNVLQSNEQCDDGNSNGGDGCSAACQTEISSCAILGQDIRTLQQPASAWQQSACQTLCEDGGGTIPAGFRVATYAEVVHITSVASFGSCAGCGIGGCHWYSDGTFLTNSGVVTNGCTTAGCFVSAPFCYTQALLVREGKDATCTL